MILGNTCTRSCGFLGVKLEDPKVDWDEPEKSGVHKNYEYQTCNY
jgi:lipoic acid synthetase